VEKTQNYIMGCVRTATLDLGREKKNEKM